MMTRRDKGWTTSTLIDSVGHILLIYFPITFGIHISLSISIPLLSAIDFILIFLIYMSLFYLTMQGT